MKRMNQQKLTSRSRLVPVLRGRLRLAAILGFALPLGGGLHLSKWVTGYPDGITVVRIVTLIILSWLVVTRIDPSRGRTAKRLLIAFSVVMFYALASTMWAQDASLALQVWISIAVALGTAAAVVHLVRAERAVLSAFGKGFLLAAAVQVAVASVEVLTGFHLTDRFAASHLERWDLSSFEDSYGAAAWGTMGNPNDLGGLWLLAAAIFLCRRTYGIALNRIGVIAGYMVFAIALALGATSLNDARAFQLGMLLIFLLLLLDRLVPQGGADRRLLMIMAIAALTVVLVWGSDRIHLGTSDSLRLDLVRAGLTASLESGGFGKGLGTEQFMIASGEIPLNFHNIIALVAAELGILPAAALSIYLISAIASWAFAGRSVVRSGKGTILARATLAGALLICGATSSSVVDSPMYWTLLAVTALLVDVQGGEEQPRERLTFDKPVGQPSVPAPRQSGKSMASFAADAELEHRDIRGS